MQVASGLAIPLPAMSGGRVVNRLKHRRIDPLGVEVRACRKPHAAPLVTFKEGFFQTHEIKSRFTKGGESPKILMETDQLSTMLSPMESGTAVGCLFEKLIEKESGVRAIRLEPKISVRIGLI